MRETEIGGIYWEVFLFPIWAFAWTVAIIVLHIDLARYPAYGWFLGRPSQEWLFILGMWSCLKMRPWWALGAALAFPALLVLVDLVGVPTIFFESLGKKTRLQRHDDDSTTRHDDNDHLVRCAPLRLH